MSHCHISNGSGEPEDARQRQNITIQGVGAYSQGPWYLEPEIPRAQPPPQQPYCLGLEPYMMPQPPRPPTPGGTPRPGPLAPRPNIPSPPPTP